MSNTKYVQLCDFLTVEEVVEAIKIYRDARAGTFAEQCASEIITPVLSRINEQLGQQNHPLFLAFMVEYAFIKTGVRERIEEIYERNTGVNGFHGFQSGGG